MMAWLGQYGRVSGVDIAPRALQLARERSLTRLALGSVDALPIASQRFDLVTSFDVLYHLRVNDDLQALRELCRVLRPGGLLLIRVPALNWLRGRHDVAVHTRHRYARAELRTKLQKAGFLVQHLTFANSLLFPLAPVKRLLEQRDRESLPDLWRPPGPLNRILARTLGSEASLIRRRSLPLGLSLIAVATRPT
jgi:SAM-dependent methyltransferase